MDEKKLLEQLKQNTEQITPPASLEPDAIEKMLRKNNEKEPAARKRTRTWRYLANFAGIAAIFALALTVMLQSQEITRLKDTENIQVQEEFQDETGITAETEGDLILETEAGEAENPADDEMPTTDDQLTAADETEKPANSGIPMANGEIAAADAGMLIGEGLQMNNGALASGSSLANGTSETRNGTSASAEIAEETTKEQDKTSTASSSTDADEPEPEETDSLTYAESYEEIYDRLHQSIASYDTGDGGVVYSAEAGEYALEDTMELSTADMAATSASTRASSNSGSTDFSETNLQELGVDEGDIVKTDGTYIYILQKELFFSIVKADGETSSLVSTTSLNCSGLGSPYIQEMYLDGDTLSIIVSGQTTSLTEEEDVYYSDTNNMTVLYTYNITDRFAPVLSGTLNQEGYYSDSRKTGSYLYLFTEYHPVVKDTYEESTIMPRINGEVIQPASFYLPEKLEDTSYLVIASVELSHPEQVVDQKVLISGASHYYVSTENIYIASENDTYSSSTFTELVKFSYTNGQIRGIAAGSVKGYLNNSFSLNEYEGNLRVVSTYYDDNFQEWNALYILDENLNQLGAIKDLGQGETIRSARFFGDTGYFVTFRQTDPLFSVDLSDPEHPEILGELKVSGFSSYLHFYGENQLLGIGYEADETTGVVSGLKLSMFDISDPANVTETSRILIPGITWCPAIEDYKSILVDPEKNVIGFFCDNRYLVYSYDEEAGFTRELLYDFYTDNLAGQAESSAMRGLYIEDTLYLAGNTYVISFDMEDAFKKTGVLDLN